MKWTKRRKSILYGMILGDGYLQKTGKKNARLRLEHSKKQKEYIFWKVKQLPGLFQGKPKFLKRIHPNGRVYEYYRHQSNSTPFLGKLKKVFYGKRGKEIPENIGDFLSPLALAVWYMDDGYYYARDRCAYLYLGRVTLKEAETVRKTLFLKFALEAKILDKKEKGFAIYFPSSEMKKFKKLIGKFVIPALKEKIPPDPVTTERNPTESESSETR